MINNSIAVSQTTQPNSWVQLAFAFSTPVTVHRHPFSEVMSIALSQPEMVRIGLSKQSQIKPGREYCPACGSQDVNRYQNQRTCSFCFTEWEVTDV